MILDRYILRLWLSPFLAAFLIAMTVLLLGRALKVLQLISENSAGWSVVFLMLSSILPYFLVLTIPIAAFFAMQSVMLRLQQSSELDAFRAAGVSYFRMFRSLLAVSLLLWVGLTYTAMEWMPQGQKAFQNFIYAIKTAKATPSFDPQRFNESVDDFTIYIDGQDDQGRMLGFMLEDKRYGVPVIYLCEWAEIRRIGQYIHFGLHNGTRLEGEGNSLRVLAFEEYQVNYDAGQMGVVRLSKDSGSILQMGMKELTDYRRQHDSPGAMAEWHRRLVLPMSIVVLMLFAFPLSIEPKRSGKAGAYLLGVLVMLAVYNLQITLYQQVSMGKAEWWVMWLGVLGSVGLGVELCRRAAADRLPSLLGTLGELFYQLHQRTFARMARRRAEL